MQNGTCGGSTQFKCIPPHGLAFFKMKTPTPEWVEQICANFGSIGDSPKYRVIWAPDREEFCFGLRLKAYPHVGERWILEVLIPWEKFGQWNYDAFGPKPLHGEYSHSQTIEFIEGEGKNKKTAFMSLEDYGAETLRLLITCVDKGKLISYWQIKNHREQMLAEQQKNESQQFSDEWDEVQGIGLVGGPLGENAVSGIPGKKTSADQRVIMLEDLSPELQRRLRCKPGSVRQIQP